MIDVRPARDRAEVDAALALRHEVFVVEQRVSPTDEQDGRDDQALHLVGVRDGRVVGTCRVLREGDTARLGRMAVAASARRHGIALRLLAAAEEHARTAGARRIALAAQTEALGLYERAGYAARGTRFLDAGIEHLMMDKRLG